MNHIHVGEREAKNFLDGVLLVMSTTFHRALTQTTQSFYTQYSQGVKAAYWSVHEGCPLSIAHDGAVSSIKLDCKELDTKTVKAVNSS